MAKITVTKVETMGSKKDFFIAREEEQRVQFTGETKKEALEKLEAFLKDQQ